jgi:hypothetical protein
MELNEFYDHLWNMGTLLQSEDALSILDVDRLNKKANKKGQKTKMFDNVAQR